MTCFHHQKTSTDKVGDRRAKLIRNQNLFFVRLYKICKIVRTHICKIYRKFERVGKYATLWEKVSAAMLNADIY